MSVKSDNYQIGLSPSPGYNFTWNTDSFGALLLQRGIVSGGVVVPNQDILTVDSSGNVSVPNGVLKQTKAKRSFFSVYMPSNFGFLTVDQWTAVGNLWVEVIDSANAFTTSGGPGIGGVYKPVVAGWYQINCCATISGNVNSQAVAAIFKNGLSHRRIGGAVISTSELVSTMLAGSTVVYLNGTTDYIDLRLYTNQVNANLLGDAQGEQSWMNGYLIEAD